VSLNKFILFFSFFKKFSLSVPCKTEVSGEFRCGKTQLSHTLCVTTQLPGNHGGALSPCLNLCRVFDPPLLISGANGKVLFIDTEGTFRSERIRDICERFGVDGDAVLENILHARASNHEMQAEFLNDCAAIMVQVTIITDTAATP